MEYSWRAFTLNDSEWGWCFGEGWVAADNTVHGAAARIEWMLEHGVPEDWEYQQCGDEPLVYAAVGDSGDAHTPAQAAPDGAA